MKTSSKIIIAIAVVLVIAGAVIFAAVLGSTGWNFKQLDTSEFIDNTYTFDDDISDISIDSDTARIKFVPATDGKCTVECHEEKDQTHKVSVENGTLKIKATDERTWYAHVGVNLDSPTITISLPKSGYNKLTIDESTGSIKLPSDLGFSSVDIEASTGDITCESSVEGTLKIHVSTGDINLKKLTAGELDLKVSTGAVNVESVDCGGKVSITVSTGKTKLDGLTCDEFTSSGSTGHITLKDVKVNGKLNIKRSTGDVKFESSDAEEITVVTSTGDVTGSLLTNKIFFTDSDTGKINVPKTTSGGKCDISTDTGDIRITIE